MFNSSLCSLLYVPTYVYMCEPAYPFHKLQVLPASFTTCSPIQGTTPTLSLYRVTDSLAMSYQDNKRERDDFSFLNRLSTHLAPSAKRVRCSSESNLTPISACDSHETIGGGNSTSVGGIVLTPFGPGRIISKRGLRMGVQMYQVQLIDANACSTGLAMMHINEGDMQAL